MRILIINDLLVHGGTEVFVSNLKKILEKKNEVYILSFDKNYTKNIKKVDNANNIININPNAKFEKLNKLFFNPFLYLKIKKALKKIKPDKIIINNIFYNPITQIKAIKKYELYQIVHDYSVVCPKSTCLKDNMSVCGGYKEGKCTEQCNYHSSKIMLNFKLMLTKRMEKLRKKYIKLFIAPSKKLTEYLNNYGYNCIYINNPIEFYENNNIKKANNIKKYVYAGAINKNKGIFDLLQAFNEFSVDKDVELEVIGKISTEEDKKKFDDLIKGNDKIKYCGFISNKEVLKKVAEAHFMVVPSLWMENYPTSVLEAMLVKTLVLGSNRGGIPEMLENDRGKIFNISNKEDVIKCLNEGYSINYSEYVRIVNNAYEYLKTNNSFEMYYNKIKKYIEEVKND